MPPEDHRTPTRRDSGTDGGWTPLRVLGLLIALCGLVGFGVCGLCGITIAIGGSGADVLGLGIGGLLIATGFGLGIRAIVRRVRNES